MYDLAGSLVVLNEKRLNVMEARLFYDDFRKREWDGLGIKITRRVAG